ncbi:uncharacterized protein EV420DRAFT_1623707 [Desarmillaria tabescens]|uniref:Uncharacterized protein n=1 Tax=Armillaria tabescens TaxID=1929756 RepID=A0AA39MIS1_ARMTA|nr:uncharacterized protein EV420DRAFT_1623707 [Desarmillaria tabescens]KAK0434975.1 hypothetical protein EV420DRAFT_1623707 [Desarmillaria tabescens]
MPYLWYLVNLVLDLDDPDLEAMEYNESLYKLDNIKTIYHPSSSLPSRIDPLDDHHLGISELDHIKAPIDPQPWHPFRSLLEFELCEFVLDTSLTNGLTATLLSILERCATSPTAADKDNTESVAHLHSPKDIGRLWDQASNLRTPFNKSSFTLKLKGKEYHYNVYHHCLLKWAVDLIQDPNLAPYFVWDAIKLSKWNGKEFVRFWHEPWTGDHFWNLQDTLPPGGKLLCYILYANKTRLSSFETAQGYPVVVRCGNLPVDIRNGSVWHAVFNFILSLCWAELIHVFSVLFILSADYEEQTVMALTRGSGGKKPCPVCLVPDIEQNRLEAEYEHRSREQVRSILQTVASMRRKMDQNELLSEFGLCNIENVFFNWDRADPYLALSFDPLHANDDGLFGKHLRTEVVARITNLGRSEWEQADAQIRLFPWWRNLYHFESGFMAVTFTDGGKYEDLSKQILYIVHNIITKQRDKHGYLLLRCIHSYLELDMCAKLHVHTSETLQAVETEVKRFGSLIQVSGCYTNFNTKPNEKMHGSLKDSYQLRTNFKDIAEQILRVDQWFNAASFIRQQIDIHDQQLEDIQVEEEGDDEGDGEHVSAPSGETAEQVDYTTKASLHGGHGKGQGSWKLEDLELQNGGNPAFTNFRQCLSEYMVEVFKTYSEKIPIIGNEKVVFTEFQLYDKVDRWYFGQLVLLFECSIGGKAFPIVLIHPFSEPVGQSQGQVALDLDLGFYRVRAKKRSSSVFISIYSIVQGALLVEDFGYKTSNGPDARKEYLVVDAVDSDMFLRMKKLSYIGQRQRR